MNLTQMTTAQLIARKPKIIREIQCNQSIEHALRAMAADLRAQLSAALEALDQAEAENRRLRREIEHWENHASLEPIQHSESQS